MNTENKIVLLPQPDMGGVNGQQPINPEITPLLERIAGTVNFYVDSHSQSSQWEPNYRQTLTEGEIEMVTLEGAKVKNDFTLINTQEVRDTYFGPTNNRKTAERVLIAQLRDSLQGCGTPPPSISRVISEVLTNSLGFLRDYANGLPKVRTNNSSSNINTSLQANSQMQWMKKIGRDGKRF